MNNSIDDTTQIDKTDENDEADDIVGPFKDAALIVRRFVGTKSVRSIELKTGVNYRTIDNMKKGTKADSQNVIRFARAFKFNPNTLLKLYELDLIPEFDLVEWENQTTSADAANSADSTKTAKPARPTRLVGPTKPAAPATEARPEDDERVRMRILTEFEVVATDGSTRPVQMDDLSPQMRRKLAQMLLAGEFGADSASDSASDSAGTPIGDLN